MFPACYFCQITYVKQSHMNGTPNETRIHPCRFVSRLTNLHMFSDETNKLETYTYVRTKFINLKKNTNLSVDLFILKYIYIYIYIYYYV